MPHPWQNLGHPSKIQTPSAQIHCWDCSTHQGAQMVQPSIRTQQQRRLTATYIDAKSGLWGDSPSVTWTERAALRAYAAAGSVPVLGAGVTGLGLTPRMACEGVPPGREPRVSRVDDISVKAAKLKPPADELDEPTEKRVGEAPRLRCPLLHRWPAQP